MRSLLASLLAVGALTACSGSGDGPARPDLGSDAASVDAGTGSDAGLDDGSTTDAGPGSDAACTTLSLAPVAAGLTSPSCAIAPPGDDRLFVCERTTGHVQVLDASGTVGATPFLDVSAALSTTGFEMGVLALAFHPNYATHPRVFVTYTTATNLRVVSFDVPSATASTVTAGSEQTILEVPLLDTIRQHTAGALAFGSDGFLYVAVGDMDSLTVSQNVNDLHGKILRLDVDATGMPYAIPPTNPFVGMAGHRGEIWAYGFREPYRISFDATGALFIGEVGDNAYEEVDVLAAGMGGGNYGWPITEGNGHCHTPSTGCMTAGLTPPVYEYPHGALSDAIMGGYVYAGTVLPACWRGRYFYGDYQANFLASFAWDGTTATDARVQSELHADTPVSLGLDGHGEILVIGFGGTIVRIAPP